MFVYFEIQILGKAITIKYILYTILMHRNRRISEFRYRIINIYFLNYRKYCANYKLAPSAFETIRILTVEKYALKNFIFHLYCELTRQKKLEKYFSSSGMFLKSILANKIQISRGQALRTLCMKVWIQYFSKSADFILGIYLTISGPQSGTSLRLRLRPRAWQKHFTFNQSSDTIFNRLWIIFYVA